MGLLGLAAVDMIPVAKTLAAVKVAFNDKLP